MPDNVTCGECGADIPAGAPGGMCPQCLLKQGLDAAKPTAPFTPPSIEELDELLPQFDVIELLGRGGMGAVYKARQRSLDRIVAIKVLPINAGPDPEFAERFAREARTLAGLAHPNIVTVHDFGETGELYYFVMEFVEGRDLRRILESGPMSPEDTFRTIFPICDAVQHAHDRGVVHRDIKPANIIVDKSDTPKIADFGLAKILDPEASRAELTMSDQAMGTPLYMAPEQRDPSANVDHRADVYSLGVVVYEMLTGALPVGNFRPLSHVAGLDNRMDNVVLKAMDTDPNRRYRSVADMRADMTRTARSLPTVPTEGGRRRTRGSRIALALLWTTILAALVVPTVLLRRHRPPQDVTQFGEHYYKVFLENISWHEAKRKCESMGGYLAIVTGKEEDEFLASLSRSHVWIGASDEKEEGNWTWIDGSPVEYANWDSREPNNARDPRTGEQENHLMISKYGKWNDLTDNSSIIHGFVCEWDADKHPGPFQISSPKELHAAFREVNPGYEGDATILTKDGIITEVSILHTRITDLSPLQGMRLERLCLAWSKVTDISPLQGMSLKVLDLSRSQVTDLAPIAGMPLTELRIEGTKVGSLAPLHGMKLIYLDISHTPITDLSPIADMPLAELHMSCTRITDLSPIKQMPMKRMGMLDVPVTDLTALASCPTIESLDLPTTGNIECLKALPNLKRINGKAPADFWKQ